MATQTLRHGDDIYTDVPEGADISTSPAGNFRHLTALAHDARRQGLGEVADAFIRLRDTMAKAVGADISSPASHAESKAGYELSQLLKKVKYVPGPDVHKLKCLPCTVEKAGK